MNPNLIKSIIVIHGQDDAELPELNVQASDDLEKVYELECKVRLKDVLTFSKNNIKESARHQYYLELVSIDKFKEEST